MAGAIAATAGVLSGITTFLILATGKYYFNL